MSVQERQEARPSPATHWSENATQNDYEMPSRRTAVVFTLKNVDYDKPENPCKCSDDLPYDKHRRQLAEGIDRNSGFCKEPTVSSDTGALYIAFWVPAALST
jgi:hypothetical protein